MMCGGAIAFLVTLCGLVCLLYCKAIWENSQLGKKTEVLHKKVHDLEEKNVLLENGRQALEQDLVDVGNERKSLELQCIALMEKVTSLEKVIQEGKQENGKLSGEIEQMKE